MKEYHDLLEYILDKGEVRDDRTGVGTMSVFGQQMRFNLQDGFPAITTKKLAWKSCVAELIWFLEGSSDERRLAEIQYGTREQSKTTIWTANSNAPYWKDKAKFDGDLGRVYGVQWRSWNKYREIPDFYEEHITIVKESVDQIETLINDLKNNPFSRRHILTAWNVGELDNMALPPCHMMAQFYVSRDKKLSCFLHQRSCDMFLGVPFNIASYSLLTHILAKECGLDVGEFVWSGGDCHIYLSHVDAVKEQLTRNHFPLPTLSISPNATINNHTVDDYQLVGYQSHGTIKADMAV